MEKHEDEKILEKEAERCRQEIEIRWQENEKYRQELEKESERFNESLLESAQSAFDSISKFDKILKSNAELKKRQEERRKEYYEEQAKKKEEKEKKEKQRKAEEQKRLDEIKKLEEELRELEEKNRKSEQQITKRETPEKRENPHEQNISSKSLFDFKSNINNNQHTSKKTRIESDINPYMTKQKTETRTYYTEQSPKSADEILQEREINTQVDIESFNSLFEKLKYLYTTGDIEYFLNGVEKQLIEGAHAKITVAENSNKGLFQKKKRQEQISHAKKEYSDLINKFYEQETKSRINGINDILGRLQRYGISEMVSSEQKKLEMYSEQLSNETEEVRDVESQKRLEFLKDFTDKLNTIMSEIAQNNRFMDSNTSDKLLGVSLKSLTYRGLERGVDITETFDSSKLDKLLDELPTLLR